MYDLCVVNNKREQTRAFAFRNQRPCCWEPNCRLVARRNSGSRCMAFLAVQTVYTLLLQGFRGNAMSLSVKVGPYVTRLFDGISRRARWIALSSRSSRTDFSVINICSISRLRCVPGPHLPDARGAMVVIVDSRDWRRLDLPRWWNP